MGRLLKLVLLILFLIPINLFGQKSLSDDIHYLELADEKIESNSDTAFFLAKRVYLQSKNSGDAYLEALSGQILGKILFYQGRFNQASEYLLESAEILQELEEKKALAETYIWLGAVCQYALQYPLSLNYYLEAQKIFESQQDLEGLADTYSWIGHYYEKIESPDTAIYYQHKSLTLFRSIEHNEAGIANVYDNLGSLYEDLKVYDSASFYFRKAYAINLKLNRVNNLIVNLNNIGDIYRKTDQLDSALMLGDSTLKMAKQNNLMYQIRTAYWDLSKIYKLKDDYQVSYTYLDSALTIYTEIFSNESAQRIAQLQTSFDNEQKEAEIQLLEKEKAQNRNLRIALIIALIIIVIAAVIVFRYQRTKILSHKKIIEQRTQLTKVEQELLVADLKNALLNEQNLKNELINRELTEKQLREELAVKSQSLTTHTLSIIRKNNFLEELQEELKRIKKLEKQKAQKALNQLIASINLNFIHEEDWNEFQRVFEEIHVGFFEELKKEFTDLSPTDLRLCALLKLNLDSRDIATIMGISQDSLRVARYRLKKKLNLEKGESLSSYLITH